MMDKNSACSNLIRNSFTNMYTNRGFYHRDYINKNHLTKSQYLKPTPIDTNRRIIYPPTPKITNPYGKFTP